MGVYKTLTPSDITRVPFDANKLYTFNSSSATNVGIGFQKFEFVSSSLDSYSSVSTDTSSSIRYHQLDHLFYRNHRLDISNKLGDADYLNQFRTLHRRANVINIPSGLFGNKIKPGTFQITGSGWNVVDDKRGNLIISGTQLVSHSIDEREKVFSLGPVKGFKKYDLKAHFYGENHPEPDTYYNKENVNDDSYYTNTLDFKNILFTETSASVNIVSKGDFAGITQAESTTGADWTTQAGWTIAGGKAIYDGSVSGYSSLTQPGALNVGSTYEVSFDLTLAGGSIEWKFGNPFGGTQSSIYVSVSSFGSERRKFKEIINVQDNQTIMFLANIGTTSAIIENVKFIEIPNPHRTPVAHFNNSITSTVTSSIVAPHNELYNFNPDENFAISMYVNPKKVDGYIISKSTTKTIIKEPTNTKLYITGSSQLSNTTEKNHYPFEVFLNEENNGQGTFQLINFRRSDGIDTSHVSCSLSQNTLSHVVCMKSGSEISLYVNGAQTHQNTDMVSTYAASAFNNGTQKATKIDLTSRQTENQANLYIGSKGEVSDYFSGSLSNLIIFNQHRTDNQISNLFKKIDGTPYVGNIFYSNGLATITHPNYQHIAKPHASNDYQVKFKSINTIYENEFMCTVRSDEYNYTHNISTRKIKSDQHTHLANFATGSIWKPYVTTIGLFNEDNELLIVGKLGQPVRMSDETDTTFVIKYDN